jgi:hypothetical protein
MKVKCKNIFNVFKNEFEQESYSLTIGKEYVVLEVSISPNHSVYFRLICDNDGMPALFDSKQFDITSNKISSEWIVRSGNMDCIKFSSPFWTTEFWDNLYDGDNEALEVYKRVAKRIVDDENI